jgi:hypothetical protein
MKLYTEEQLRNSMNSVRYYIENYNENVINSMIEKHIKALVGIQFVSDLEDLRMLINLIEKNKT